GPGRVVLEKTCLYCHGNNFFPIKQFPEAQWNHYIDYMLGKDNDRGAMVPPGTLSATDRAVLLAYLMQNFGPQREKRGLESYVAFPVDEAALGKAMYVEYYLPL